MNRAAFVVALVAACDSKPPPVATPRPPPPATTVEPTPAPPPSQPPLPARHDALARIEFNRWAVRENLPIYWIEDRNRDGNLDPDEVAALLFYPTAGKWSEGGRFTPQFELAYRQIVAAARAPAPVDDAKRRALVVRDLDQGRASLVHSDLSGLTADERAFAGHLLTIASLIDRLYEELSGAAAVADKLPADLASRSLFRRNRGPQCVAPATEHEAECSALPGNPKPVFGLYPAELQRQANFCGVLAKHRNAKALLDPFTVVRGTPEQLTAVPLTEAYKDLMGQIARELTAAADAIGRDPKESALVSYLRAAATSFTTNDWKPADEAWSRMTVDNSKWYVRVAPDEVYWEPCSQKAGPHLTFALINQGSREWQGKLVPVQQEMEAAIAGRAGKPYAERKVTFHLPDFIDIVINAGDDRDPLGATIGQSLPNWGPVADQGRGRTIAMVNLYNDPDSRTARRAQAESLLTAETMKHYSEAGQPGLLSTILHEATHNFGPAHDYKVANKTAPQIFGGPLASTLEELKAQSGALFLVEFLRSKKLIDDQLAAQSYVDGIVWAFGHISQGMYDGDKKPKNYSQLAAIQIGFLIERGALVWDATAKAANGKDSGAFTLKLDKIVSATDELMKLTAGIKARGDKPAAAKLLADYVDSAKIVPHPTISERFLRFPKASFVYSVAM